MNISKKTQNRIGIGIIVFSVYIFISIVLQHLCNTSIGSSWNLPVFLTFPGKILEFYGYTSILVPVFFFVAGIFLFLPKWNDRWGIYLIGSIIPFFTVFAAELLSRSFFTQSSSSVLGIKISVVFLVTIIAISLEYVIIGFLADFIFEMLKTKNKAEATESVSETEVEEEIIEENNIVVENFQKEDVEIESETVEEKEETEVSNEKKPETLKKINPKDVSQNFIQKIKTTGTSFVDKIFDEEINVQNPKKDSYYELKSVEAKPLTVEESVLEELQNIEKRHNDKKSEEKETVEEQKIPEKEPEPFYFDDGEEVIIENDYVNDIFAEEEKQEEKDNLLKPFFDATNNITPINQLLKDEIREYEDKLNQEKVAAAESVADNSVYENYPLNTDEDLDRDFSEEFTDDASESSDSSGILDESPVVTPESMLQQMLCQEGLLSEPVKKELPLESSENPTENEKTEVFEETEKPVTEENANVVEAYEEVSAEEEPEISEENPFIEQEAEKKEIEEPEEGPFILESLKPKNEEKAFKLNLDWEKTGLSPVVQLDETENLDAADLSVFDEQVLIRDAIGNEKEASFLEDPFSKETFNEKSDVKNVFDEKAFQRAMTGNFGSKEKESFFPKPNFVDESLTKEKSSGKNDFEPIQPSYMPPKIADVSNIASEKTEKPVHYRVKEPYKVPAEGLLNTYPDGEYWIIDAETQKSANILKETLSEFKIEAEVTGIKKGPVITMFEILPAPGVKLNRIAALQDNIALKLAASSVRIVAPIPGKHAVGIEVPNKERAIVSFKELIDTDAPAYKKMEIPVVLGKDITGEAKMLDLAATPHLLIAGSTGSGKSVCVNTMILSILYKRSPDEVKMILIDPKIVELKLYNDIPHLLTPVITEPKKAFQALQYCLCEMERRYAMLDKMGVRDIKSYNRRISERNLAMEKIPYLVVIIDEFADLMATTGKELESTVARLAAMSRAVGVHLVLATQRPSIDVITGLIKANIPTRIAFMVASKTDSRIIIDQMGAEKLLGKGDMLYSSAVDPFPVRIQGTFVSENEVENVVNYVKKFGPPDYIDEEIFVDDEEEESESSSFDEGTDPLYDQALEIVIQAGKASASYIQRRLKIGYNRAARLVEDMEARGIVGPANGSKPRDIIHIPSR